MPVFDPAVLTWPNGQVITLTREGDTVTAEIDLTAVAGVLDPSPVAWPAAHFGPYGQVALFWQSSPEYQVSIAETQINLIAISGHTPPWPNLTAKWLADPIPDANWPITAADLRTALQIGPADEDTDELALFALAACERIDQYTGRDIDQARHELTPGKLPTIFVLAARETAKLWWQQTKNGARNRPQQGEAEGPPAGADLPRKVQGWLGGYPPRLYREPTT